MPAIWLPIDLRYIVINIGQQVKLVNHHCLRNREHLWILVSGWDAISLYSAFIRITPEHRIQITCP